MLSTFHELTCLGGVRVYGRQGRVIPFAHVLGGVARANETETYSSGRYGPYSYTNSPPIIQAGAGIDIMANSRFGFRLVADLPFVPFVGNEGADIGMFRMIIGGVVPLGTK